MVLASSTDLSHHLLIMSVLVDTDLKGIEHSYGLQLCILPDPGAERFRAAQRSVLMTRRSPSMHLLSCGKLPPPVVVFLGMGFIFLYKCMGRS